MKIDVNALRSDAVDVKQHILASHGETALFDHGSLRFDDKLRPVYRPIPRQHIYFHEWDIKESLINLPSFKIEFNFGVTQDTETLSLDDDDDYEHMKLLRERFEFSFSIRNQYRDYRFGPYLDSILKIDSCKNGVATLVLKDTESEFLYLNGEPNQSRWYASLRITDMVERRLNQQVWMGGFMMLFPDSDGDVFTKHYQRQFIEKLKKNPMFKGWAKFNISVSVSPLSS